GTRHRAHAPAHVRGGPPRPIAHGRRDDHQGSTLPPPARELSGARGPDLAHPVPRAPVARRPSLRPAAALRVAGGSRDPDRHRLVHRGAVPEPRASARGDARRAGAGGPVLRARSAQGRGGSAAAGRPAVAPHRACRRGPPGESGPHRRSAKGPARGPYVDPGGGPPAGRSPAPRGGVCLRLRYDPARHHLLSARPRVARSARRAGEPRPWHVAPPVFSDGRLVALRAAVAGGGGGPRPRAREPLHAGRRARGLGGPGRCLPTARGRGMSRRGATTMFEAFMATATAAPDHAFLCAPPAPGRAYDPDGVEYTYAQTRAEVDRLRHAYAAAGYGHGHRVALLLENRPEMFFHYLALNALGAGVVPVNPDYRHDELAYQLDHSEADLAVSVPERAST